MNEEELLYNEIYEKIKDCGRNQFIKLLMAEKRESKIWKEKYQEMVLECQQLRQDNLIKYLEHKIRIFESRVMEHDFDDDLIRLNTYWEVLERVKSGKYE